MSLLVPSALEVEVRHRVHQGLTLDVSLDLESGCGVLFGDSGAGKTTLLRLIAGLETPQGGRIRLGGLPLFDSSSGTDLPLRLRGVGMIFQDDLLFPHLGVAANVAFGLKGKPRRELRARLAEVSALCGIDGLLTRRPATLSGGERQRVGLARALAPRPRLLLCDEPFSALDLTSRKALIDRLRDARRAERIPMLYVTHSPAEAIALGDLLFRLDGGRIVARGTPADVLAESSGRVAPPPIAAIRNRFDAEVEGHDPDGSTRILLRDGHRLHAPGLPLPPGSPVTVEVPDDEVILVHSTGTPPHIGARNVLPGVVLEASARDRAADVRIRTGALTWIATPPAPLDLAEGAQVLLILPPRGCRIRARDSPGGDRCS